MTIASRFASKRGQSATIRQYASTTHPMLANGYSEKFRTLVSMKDHVNKQAYRMYRRNGVFYAQNNETGEQKTLRTSDKSEAKTLLSALNQTKQATAINLELGKVYLRAADPQLAIRTWEVAIDELSQHGKESSQKRCRRELSSPPFNLIKNKPMIETTAEDLKAVLKRGGAATNNYLRRLHNLALGNGWIFSNIIPPRQWEKPTKKPKRGITEEEHGRIIGAEANLERRNYYDVLWFIGSAQSDAALLTASSVNWEQRILSYRRMKTGEWAHLEIGKSLEAVLKDLPREGFLFPKIATLSDSDRSAEFARRCRQLGIKGVTLHSYRYAWAERAYKAGYSERYAQAALGHKSAAVHHGYAKNAVVVCPPLETEQKKIIPFSPPNGPEEFKEKTA